MYHLRIFIGDWCAEVRAPKLVTGFCQLARENDHRLIGPLTYCPATKTIFHKDWIL